jgi:hypothetical protein
MLPGSLIDEIRTWIGKDEVILYTKYRRPEKTCRSRGGPFQGMEALVSRLLGAKDRAQTLIEWMGRSLYFEVNI